MPDTEKPQTPEEILEEMKKVQSSLEKTKNDLDAIVGQIDFRALVAFTDSVEYLKERNQLEQFIDAAQALTSKNKLESFVESVDLLTGNGKLDSFYEAASIVNDFMKKDGIDRMAEHSQVLHEYNRNH